MDPQGHSQPSRETAYKTSGNAATANPAEKRTQEHHHHQDNTPHGQRLDERLPTSGSQQQDGGAPPVPSSLGYGVRGAPPGEESRGRTDEDVGRHRELEGEQMVAGAAEGRVASAVESKPGATGSEPDLLSDLDRKKAEQAPKREAIKEGRKNGTYNEGIDARAAGNEGLRDA